MITGNIIGAIIKNPDTIILRTDDGSEYAAAMTDEEVMLTADANDVRMGETFVSQKGVDTGEKDIPSYNTKEGYQFVPSGRAFEFIIKNCEYTKLQVLICKFDSSVANSVSTDRVSIDGKVYAVDSTDAIATVMVDSVNKKINLGISNDSETPYLIRYFTYKEIY